MKFVQLALVAAGLALAGGLAGRAVGAPDDGGAKDGKTDKPAVDSKEGAGDREKGKDKGDAKGEGEAAKPADAKAEEGLAPDFSLKDTNDEERTLSKLRGKWVVLEWINHGCPFVRKQYDSGNMQALQEKYTGKGVVWLSICSSAPGKQGHMSNEKWNETIEAKKSKATAVLVDADGKVGKLYAAKVTPTMVVISPQGKVVYQGAIDSIRSADPEDCKIADNYVAQVLDAGLAGKEPEVENTDAYG